jgi:protein translocase SecG subunit
MVLMQDSKKGMSQALTGASSDNFYQKNSGRSKEAQLARATRTAAILFFVVTLVVNVFAIYFRGGTGELPAETGSEILLDGDLEGIDLDALFAGMES